MNTLQTYTARRRGPRVPLLVPVYVFAIARAWREEVAGR
jgi:hypothetical protein